MQLMLAVLEGELPSNRALPPLGTQSNDFVYAYGVEIGFRNAVAKLKQMGEELVIPEDVPSTFEDLNNSEDSNV